MGDNGSRGANLGLRVVAILVLALFAGFLLTDLAGILIFGRDAGIAIGQILWRIALIVLCVASIASIVARPRPE